MEFSLKNILIINAHQPFEGISPGKLNQTMVDVITEEMKGRGHEVRHTEINKGYDINEEVEKHVWADVCLSLPACPTARARW